MSPAYSACPATFSTPSTRRRFVPIAVIRKVPLSSSTRRSRYLTQHAIVDDVADRNLSLHSGFLFDLIQKLLQRLLAHPAILAQGLDHHPVGFLGHRSLQMKLPRDEISHLPLLFLHGLKRTDKTAQNFFHLVRILVDLFLRGRDTG